MQGWFNHLPLKCEDSSTIYPLACKVGSTIHTMAWEVGSTIYPLAWKVGSTIYNPCQPTFYPLACKFESPIYLLPGMVGWFIHLPPLEWEDSSTILLFYHLWLGKKVQSLCFTTSITTSMQMTHQWSVYFSSVSIIHLIKSSGNIFQKVTEVTLNAVNNILA